MTASTWNTAWWIPGLILLDQKALPSDARGLELLDILLINGFSTESLTEDQRTAILQWVERGGTLLLGTGQEAEKVLGGFSEDLGGVRIRGYEKKKVGLGVEYAQDSPEDAQVELMCAELSVPGGRVVMEGDDIPLLTVIRRGKGKMGFFSYDLGEIRGFAEKTPGYVAEILTKTLGQEAVSQLYYYSSYGRNDDYWSAQSLVSTGSVDRLPRIPLYMAVTAVYILGGRAGALPVSEKEGPEPVLRNFCGHSFGGGLSGHLSAGNGDPVHVGILYSGYGTGYLRGHGGGDHLFRCADAGQPSLFPAGACGVFHYSLDQIQPV